MLQLPGVREPIDHRLITSVGLSPTSAGGIGAKSTGSIPGFKCLTAQLPGAKLRAGGFLPSLANVAHIVTRYWAYGQIIVV